MTFWLRCRSLFPSVSQYPASPSQPLGQKLDHGWPEHRKRGRPNAAGCVLFPYTKHSWSKRETAPGKVLCASCSVQVALRKLLCASCSAQVALGKALCAIWSVQVGLRKLLCATCSAQVALKCKLHLATPARGPGRNRTRDPPVPGAGARTTRQLPRTSSNNKSRKKPRSRRGLRGHRRNRKKPWVFAPRPRRSPQRVARACWKSQKHGFLHLDHADPRRGSLGHVGNRKNQGFLHLDHADPRSGSIFV